MEPFFQKRYRKVIGAIVGTVILGALGSGLWEGILKPAIGSTRDIVLNLLSFGMISIKNSTYAQIAKDLHEEASMNLLFYVILALVFVNVGLIIFSFYQSNASKKALNSLKATVAKLKSGEIDNHADVVNRQADLIAKAEKVIQEHPARGLAFGTWAASIFTLLAMSMLVSDFVRFSYANAAISYYHQLEAISAPFLDQPERLNTRGKFAQIKTKQDYVTIIERLQSVAKQNGQSVPEFSIW